MSRQSIAIVGASNSRNKFGNKAVRAYAAQGWSVFPVHPHLQEIEGLPVFPTVDAVPVAKLDRISLYVPAAVGLDVLSSITKPAKEIWLNPGSESHALLELAQERQLPVIRGCSIVDIGVSPGDFP